MIKLQNVSKKFSNGRGIFDLSFQVKEGEVFGYLGPNGAGKSTTIRTLMGFLKPDMGTVTIQNFDCWSDAAEVQKKVGYLPGEITFLEGLTGLQFLNLLVGMRKLTTLSRRDELIQRFELDARTPIRKMSKGTKQKVGIVAAFMHHPEVLILDEPTSGLDPLMQQRFLELVEEEKHAGTTIFMSSHMFPETLRVCDRVGILREGRLIATEDVKNLRSIQRRVFSIQLADEGDAAKLEQSNCEIIERRGNEIDIEVRGDYNVFIQALSTCDVVGLRTHELSLEEIFMHYYTTEEVV